MARPPIEESWLAEAIEMMVRNGLTLLKATNELKKHVSTTDCENIQRRRSFQKLLRDARARYHAEVGSDPSLTKASTIGRLSILAQKLEDEGSPDKAAEALFKMAKLAGWLEAEATVSVIAGLTSKELEEAKRKIQTRMASEGDQPVVIN
jgi:hypothetical protein